MQQFVLIKVNSILLNLKKNTSKLKKNTSKLVKLSTYGQQTGFSSFSKLPEPSPVQDFPGEREREREREREIDKARERKIYKKATVIIVQ